ncbi:Pleckstrin homology domain-containing protein [Aspergillus crustosus]
MSEIQKPLEETPVVAPVAPATETPVATTEATTTEAPVVEPPKETITETPEAAAVATSAAAEETNTEETKEEPQEIKPASESTLGYKAPGLVKSLRFAKRFFYFSDEPVEAKQLTGFRANEKPAVANPIVAWASQTGKGLLFFTKRAEDKATPAGIISLADISDVTKEGSNEFLFKLNGHKHTFQASSSTERDSWVAALESKSTEAKAEKETITSSEGYKAELEKLTKPVVVAPVKPAETKEEAKEEEPKKEEEAAAVAAPTEEAKDAKSRSRSRKRASIFGSLLGKKDETEEKKEEKKEEAKAEETPAEATEAPATEAAHAVEPSTETPVAAVAPAAVAAPVEASEKKEEDKEEKKDETEQVAPAKAKRSSIFGNFFQKVTSPSHEKSEKEAAAPAEPAPVASTAPQLDNPVEEAAKPIEPESVTAAPEAEAAKDATPAETPAATESPAATTKDKRRTSFFSSFGKKKGDSDSEAAETEPKAKGNKLGGLFRKPSKAVKPEAKETAETKAEPASETAPVEESKPAETAPTTEEAKPVTVAATSTPVQAAA